MYSLYCAGSRNNIDAGIVATGGKDTALGGGAGAVTGWGWSMLKVLLVETGLSIGNVWDKEMGRSIGNVFWAVGIALMGWSIGKVLEKDLEVESEIFEEVNDVNDIVEGTAKSPNSSSRSRIELG